ncbi:MAG TPA: VWA domain-containing protein [Acidobacteriaceae bacterium]|nr:VWA domain-containing protein [Acidobacteriaceae bacterium]
MRSGLFSGFLALVTAVGAAAQTSGGPQYTLQTGTRIVLTDVTVLDAQGNPVHGLKQSDFSIYDDGKPQGVASFEEHMGQSQPILQEASERPGIYSNAAMKHLPAVMNVWLLDTTTISLVEQMFLMHELTDLINALPAEEPVAIYWRAGIAVNLLQNFTSDHGLLLAAIHQAMPRMVNQDAQDTTDIDTLEQMIAALSQLPGRKNMLWFSGGSSAALLHNPDEAPPGLNLRPVYDGMQRDRIAVYPIDVRGLMWENGMTYRQQHLMMQATADATGGQAFYNDSGLVEGVSRFISTDGSYYTVTYRPDDLHNSHKWHKVEVKVAGNYHLSYREGYFDDDANQEPQLYAQAKKPVLADGKPAELPNTQLEPILFEARVIAARELPDDVAAAMREGKDVTRAAGHGRTEYLIRYFVPPSAFQQSVTNGQGQVMVGTAILAVNDFGRPVGHGLQVYKLNFDPKQVATQPNGKLTVDQVIALPHGHNFVYLAVWDTATGRLGTIQLPLTVEKAQKASK